MKGNNLITLLQVYTLFEIADIFGKRDEFADIFWMTFSKNSSINNEEAEKLLESVLYKN